jgi:probable addiction module antidote protein
MKARREVRTNEESLIEMFREDPSLARDYLNDVLSDGSDAEINLAIRLVTMALGGLPATARRAGVNATQLYRTLSRNGNPGFRNLRRVLAAIGLRFAVEATVPNKFRDRRSAAPSRRRIPPRSGSARA